MPARLDARSSTLRFESFGARLKVCCADRRILDALSLLLPPSSRTVHSERKVDASFLVLEDSKRGVYTLMPGYAHGKAQTFRTLEELSSEFHFAVAMYARPYLFVHAGVVAWRGRALVFPGRSMTGKSTLVSRLVENGATYFSDEYAVFDRSGRIHPYRKALSLRPNGTLSRMHRPAPAGRIERYGVMPAPVAVGVLAFLKYKSNSQWRPRQLTPAEAVLALFKNTIAAQTRGEFALRTLSRVARGASSIEGVRPDVSVAAPALIEFASESASAAEKNAKLKPSR